MPTTIFISCLFSHIVTYKNNFNNLKILSLVKGGSAPKYVERFGGEEAFDLFYFFNANYLKI